MKTVFNNYGINIIDDIKHKQFLDYGINMRYIWFNTQTEKKQAPSRQISFHNIYGKIRLIFFFEGNGLLQWGTLWSLNGLIQKTFGLKEILSRLTWKLTNISFVQGGKFTLFRGKLGVSGELSDVGKTFSGDNNVRGVSYQSYYILQQTNMYKLSLCKCRSLI